MKTAENDNYEVPKIETEWVSAVIVLTLPLAIFAVALGCQFFV